MKRLMIMALIIGLTACSKTSSPEEKPEDQKISVTSIEAKAAPITKSVRVVGVVKAIDSVAIYSKVCGKLVNYLIKNGTEIKKGELMAYVDRDEVGYKYNHAPIYCPMGGIVSSLPLNQGSEVRADTPIGYVVNIDNVHAVFNLPEIYRIAVKVGQKIEVTLNTCSYAAEVAEIDPLIDPSTHSFTFKVLLHNPDKVLIPGMFASGDLVLETIDNSIMLPEEAIVALQGEWYIYKIESDQALLKKVKLGLRKEGEVQVLEGVEPGDLVIVGGNHKVSDGQKIKNKQL